MLQMQQGVCPAASLRSVCEQWRDADHVFRTAPPSAVGLAVLCAAPASAHSPAAGCLGQRRGGAVAHLDACLCTFGDATRHRRGLVGAGHRHRLVHSAVAARNFFVLDGLSVVPWARPIGDRTTQGAGAAGGADGWAILAIVGSTDAAICGPQSVVAGGPGF